MYDYGISTHSLQGTRVIALWHYGVLATRPVSRLAALLVELDVGTTKKTTAVVQYIPVAGQISNIAGSWEIRGQHQFDRVPSQLLWIYWSTVYSSSRIELLIE